MGGASGRAYVAGASRHSQSKAGGAQEGLRPFLAHGAGAETAAERGPLALKSPGGPGPPPSLTAGSLPAPAAARTQPQEALRARPRLLDTGTGGEAAQGGTYRSSTLGRVLPRARHLLLPSSTGGS